MRSPSLGDAGVVPHAGRAPATSGWRGRAATATSERRCCQPPVGADADRSLPATASPHDWLAERRFALDEGLRRLAAAARAGAIAGGGIEGSCAAFPNSEIKSPLMAHMS